MTVKIPVIILSIVLIASGFAFAADMRYGRLFNKYDNEVRTRVDYGTVVMKTYMGKIVEIRTDIRWDRCFYIETEGQRIKVNIDRKTRFEPSPARFREGIYAVVQVDSQGYAIKVTMDE